MTLRYGEQDEGEYYHVFNRSREKIFNEVVDAQHFYALLKRFNTTATRKTKEKNLSEKLVEVFAYAIIDNHFHLVVKTKQKKSLAKYIAKVSSLYALYYNKKYKREGSLFQGKYKYILLNSEETILKTIVYVSWNEKIHGEERARLVSSDVIIGRRENDEYLHINFVLQLFGDIQHFEKSSLVIIRDILIQRSDPNSRVGPL